MLYRMDDVEHVHTLYYYTLYVILVLGPLPLNAHVPIPHVPIPSSHHQAKGVDAGQAAVRVSSLELGGLVGSLLAGRISDYMIEKSAGKGGNVGKRVQVGSVCCMCLEVCGCTTNIMVFLVVFAGCIHPPHTRT